MWQNQVAPKLGGKVRGQVIITRNIKTTDLAEADVAERVARFAESENPIWASTPSTTESTCE